MVAIASARMIVCPRWIIRSPTDDHTHASSRRAPESLRKVSKLLQIQHCGTLCACGLSLAGPLQSPAVAGKLRRPFLCASLLGLSAAKRHRANHRRTVANGGIIISRRWPVAEQIEEMPTKTFEPGGVIFREGDESQSEAYLVHEGTVEARRRVDGEERVLNTLVKGDLLGEVALFRDAPHSVTAIAVEHVTLLVIPAHRLESMVRANPDLAIGLIRQLARMAAHRSD